MRTRKRAARERAGQLADGAQHHRRPCRELRGSCSSPTTRSTKAASRLWPEFRMPRSSLFSGRKVSASSISKVGWYMSMARKMAAPVALLAISGRGTRRPIIVNKVVFPHSGVGDVMPRRGKMSKLSKACAATIHSAHGLGDVRRHHHKAFEGGGDLGQQRRAIDCDRATARLRAIRAAGQEGGRPRLASPSPSFRAISLSNSEITHLRGFQKDADALVGGRDRGFDGGESSRFAGSNGRPGSSAAAAAMPRASSTMAAIVAASGWPLACGAHRRPPGPSACVVFRKARRSCMKCVRRLLGHPGAPGGPSQRHARPAVP